MTKKETISKLLDNVRPGDLPGKHKMENCNISTKAKMRNMEMYQNMACMMMVMVLTMWMMMM